MRIIKNFEEFIKEGIKSQDKSKMAVLIISDYYEIIKKLITAIMLVDGYKTLSHKDLIDYIKERYKQSDANDISVLNDLRVLRGRITYEGFQIRNSYLIQNEALFKNIIIKLKVLLNERLK